MINPGKTHTIEEYFEILRRRIWYIIVPFFLIVSGAFGYAFVSPKKYKASTLVLVSPQRVPEAYVQATVTSKVEERLQSIAQEVLSRTRLEQIISDLRLYEKERGRYTTEEVVEFMKKDVRIELPTGRNEKGYFTISYYGTDPQVVATVANRLSSHFIEENLKLREEQAVGTTEFLSTELAAATKKLHELEAAVAQYKRRFMGELPEQRDTNIKILEQLQNQYQRIGENLRAAQDRKLFLQKQLADLDLPSGSQAMAGLAKELQQSSRTSSLLQRDMTPPLSPGEPGDAYEAQKESLSRTLEELTAKYTDRHPDVIMARKKLAELETKIDSSPPKIDSRSTELDNQRKELKNQLAMTDMEIKRLADEETGISRQIGTYRTRIEHTPAREQEMTSLLREYQGTKESYELLVKKNQEAKQAENLEKRQQGEQFRVIDPARVPEKPFSPDIPRILLIGLIAGAGAGFLLAFFREQMDRSFYAADDVEITLGLKVLAVIPKIKEKPT